MAVFLLTKDLNQRERLDNDRFIQERELLLHHHTQLGDYWLNVYQQPEDQRSYKIEAEKPIYFFGSLFYKKRYGAEAAELLYQDIRDEIVDPMLLMGSFCVFFPNDQGSFNFITDAGSIYQLYANARAEFITNSFLISASVVQNKSIHEMALNANLLIGYIPYPDTLFSSVKRIQCEEKWGNFTLKKFEIKVDSIQSNNFEEHIHYQTEYINAYIDNVAPTLSAHGVEMGVSGGYDSRLILGMLQGKGIKINAHTHYKKNDPDPVIAKQLCELKHIPLKLISERPATDTQEDVDTILQGSFLQFDGRVNSMMDFGKYEYTRDYRKRLFNTNNITVSGVGGEMYRNHNFFNRKKITVNQFIIYYLINHRNWRTLHHSKKHDLLEYLKVGLKPVLSDDKYVSYKDSKRYYQKIWLRDWHGMRNTAENHFSAYVSPFADNLLSEAALQSTDHHGLLGKFEIGLIQAQNPSLINVNSSYGFAFDKIPYWKSQKELLKINMPIWLKMHLATRVMSTKGSKSLNPSYMFKIKYINALKDQNLHFEFDKFMENGGNIELVYSLGYAIYKCI